MESESCIDHAYAANMGIESVDDAKAVCQSNVEVIKLNELNDSEDHDPLCLNDMNTNSRDINGTESASDDVVTKLSEEGEKDVKGNGISADREAGKVSDAKKTGCEVKSPDDIVDDSSCTESGLESVEVSNADSLDGDGVVKENSNESMDIIQGSEKSNESTEQGSEVMDTAVNDENEFDTDDAEEAVEMESQIKSDAGNGIIMSLTRKQSGRTGKRKAEAGGGDFKILSPSKFRKVTGMSTRRSPRISTVNGNSNIESEGAVEEDSQEAHKNVGTGISEGDFAEDDMKDERSDNHALLPNMISMSDLDKAVITPKTKASPGRKHLFFKGKKASPAQTKPLTVEEVEKYSAPLEQGWKRELVYRGTYVDNNTKTQADTYYFPPVGSKLRSMVQISEWLSKHDTTLTPDNFTFMRRAIGIKGELVRNASQSRGRASVEAALKKRTIKHVKDELIHDDNDGQYDKPEIVIERDSDDYIGQMMTVMNEEEKLKNEIKVDTVLPKLDELAKPKEEKSEIQVSTNAQVVAPILVKKKISPKSTARKSTTQKTFKKSVSQITSVMENLCSLNCPGLQGMPPMLHCNVCMCLFHQECVNFFGQNGDFVCLRCKDMHPASTTGTSNATSTMLQASNPNLLKHLHLDKPSQGSPTIVRAYPNGDKIQQVDVFDLRPKSASPVIRPGNSRGQTPPISGVPLYKALPFSTGTMNPSPTMSTTLSYPVLLTPNTSFISPSSSSLFPVSIATSLLSSTSSSKSTVDSSYPGMSDYPEIRPLIKQEPMDDSYDEQKADKNIKASSEALYSLKNVLSSRIGNSSSEKGKGNISLEKSSVENNNKPLANKPSAVVSKSLKTGVNSLPIFGNIFSPPQFNALPQNVAQPRMSFGNVTPPQMQYGQNSGFRLVPVGPPIPLGGLPMVPSPGLVRMTNTCSPTSTSVTSSKSQRTPTTENKKICPKPSTIPVVVSSQDEHSHSGPLVVNAKSVTPLNGQMLTLPPPVVKKLTLNKALALKINNKQITVPPSGFFHSDDGLKVFLPPNTFPTADENIDSMSVVEQTDKTGESANNQKDSNKTEKSDENVVNKSAEKLDIRKNKFYSRCCLMQRLYGMYDCMAHIFKYLTLQELLTMGLVCKTWRKIIQLPDLWINVRFKNSRINDWEMALKYICKKNVESVSLVGVSHFEDPNRTWHQLVSSVEVLSSIKKISFCHIPATVLQTIAGKLTQLESLCAEMITDFIDDSMWQIPSKFDVGNFCTMNELRELKLKGPGGLMLPSFNFGCGLSDLGKLSKLRVLHLTSLKNIQGSDFHFISSLSNVEDLALGECEHWTEETYAYLKEMISLKCLRLECGGDTPITGMALSSLTKLETLELWKYALASTFADHIIDLKQLHHLCVYPDSTDQVAENNANTLNAVKKMSHLKTLDWVFQEDNSSTIILSDNDSRDNDQWIPFQTLSSEGTKDTPIEYISVKQLKEKHLEKALPSTKVNVYSAAKDTGV